MYEKFSVMTCASIPEGVTIGNRQASNLTWHPLPFSVSCTFIDSWLAACYLAEPGAADNVAGRPLWARITLPP